MIPATILQKDIEILLCEYCFESLDIVRHWARACLYLSAITSSLSQVLQSGGNSLEFFLFGDWQKSSYKQAIPQFPVSSIHSAGCLLFLFYKFWHRTTLTDVYGLDLLFLLQDMLSLQHSTSFASGQTVSHKYFSLLLVNFQVIVFKPGVTKYEILLFQTRDCKKHPF